MIKNIIAFLKGLWDIIVEVDSTRYEVMPSIPLHEPPIMPEEIIPPVVMPSKATVMNFCLAIESREGYIAPCKKYPTGTTAWRNKNPGNIKGLSGAFLKFDTKAQGFMYLQKYVNRVQANEHPAYPKDPTILQYFKVYAPMGDDNDPVSYASEVANKLGVPTSFLIKNLV